MRSSQSDEKLVGVVAPSSVLKTLHHDVGRLRRLRHLLGKRSTDAGGYVTQQQHSWQQSEEGREDGVILNVDSIKSRGCTGAGATDGDDASKR